MGMRAEEGTLSRKYLMSSLTKSISISWYSCIAQRIYMSVVQQKDQGRQKKARSPGLTKSTLSLKHHIRLARRAKSIPGPCPRFQLLLLMQFSPLPQIPRPSHKLPMRWNKLYRNKPFTPLLRHLPCDVCELFHEINPWLEYHPCRRLCERR